MSYNSFVYDLSEEFTYSDIISPICIVEFRTFNYDASFGFDWLRVNEKQKKELAYEDIIESGYKDGKSDLSKKDAYDNLTKEYKTIRIKRKITTRDDINKSKYFVPYLNLFSKEYSNTVEIIPAPTYKAKLEVLVQIEEKIDKIKFEYNQSLFTIDSKDLNVPTGKCEQMSAGIIEITCNKDFNKEQLIDVYSYPEKKEGMTEEEQEQYRTLAGRILVMPNSAVFRKKINFVFVSVKTNITKSGRLSMSGTFTEFERTRLCEICYQSLIIPSIIIKDESTYSPIFLDLTTDPNFGPRGKFVRGNKLNTFKIRQNNMIIDNGKDMMRYLKTIFLNKSENSKYFGYFTVFSFGEGQFSGRIESIGTKNAIVGNLRNKDTVPHEAMHGFGLYHTHRDGNPPLKNKNIKYIYPNAKVDSTKATDNILSYNVQYRKTTWRWQWKIMRGNV